MLRVLIAVSLGVAAAGSARAAMVRRMSLEEVTHAAAHIVQATVRGVRVGRDESGLPATWIDLDVTRTLKGPQASTLTIKQYGVAEPLPDGTITRVAGAPRYRVGEEVVLFLHGNSRHGFTSPVGLAQGTYRVSHGSAKAQVRRDLAGGGAIDLDDFLAEVKRLATRAP